MRTIGTFLLASSLGAALVLSSPPASAKGKAKKGDDAPPPSASAAEVNKLKAVRLGDPKAGTFNWQMKAEEVMNLAKTSIEKKYQPRVKQASQDPGKQQRIREEMERELGAMKKSYTKFEGGKGGLDVSIVGPEFQQNTGEAVLVAKEDQWTRYFFFFEDGLYKMFLAFNKDVLEGKTFQQFGKDMEGKYGRARQVYRDEKVKGGMRHVLDHFEWGAGNDRLRLIDRSEFYGVYCLVLYDQRTAERVSERRKIVNPGIVEKDALVEAVTQRDKNERDANDNIIDRITGKDVKKPGEEERGNINVPSPGGSSKPAAEEATKAPAAAPEKESGGSKKKGKKESASAVDGLEL